MTARARATSAVDVVTWAPTTAARRRARGFDQAEVLAHDRGRARRVGRAGSVLRRVGDDHQTGHSRAERIDAPEFAVARTVVAIAGRRVLVVDDVVTTGATLRAAASVLRERGRGPGRGARRGPPGLSVGVPLPLAAGGRMDSTVTRLARLRADIAAGTYAPPADAVAEALVGWIARPEQFERGGPRCR